MARCLKQNTTVDIYEEYFQNPFSSSLHAAGGGHGAGGNAPPSTSSTTTSATAASFPSLGGGGDGAGALLNDDPHSNTTSTTHTQTHRPRSRFNPSTSNNLLFSSSSTATTDFNIASEPPSAKGLAVFRDPCPIKRPATALHWHPEGHGKLAVAYSGRSFQDPRYSGASSNSNNNSSSNNKMTASYIWDVTSPNRPDVELLPPSPLCSLRYNPKSTETLVGGCYNGLVTFFDLRRGGYMDKEGVWWSPL